jgi:L-rhamnose mutarotase
LAKNPEMQKWWKETSACQIRMPGTNPNEQWKEMEMLFQLR